MENLYRKLNSIIGWALFAIASVIYIMTAEPTTSFWDCGEYISTAYKLQVGHPPGAPFFQLAGRFFSLFAFGDTAQVARMINTMSALSSGLTITFLFWSITMLARKIKGPHTEMSLPGMIAVFGSGIVGALAFAFSDSFWFSAVEGEVYAMSALFTSMTFWAILKWETVAGQPHALRWLILIAFLIGISIGVHLLNLLAIPAVVFVYFFKTYKTINWKTIAAALAASFVLMALVLYGIVPEVVSLFANTELVFVNTLGMPFNSGTYFFFLLLVSLLIVSFLYTSSDKKIYGKIIIALSAVMLLLFLLESKGAGSFFGRLLVGGAIVWVFYLWRFKKSLLNAIVLSITFILIGYSSFFLLIIRSNANPPIDENNPENAISLLSYLNREQYGDFPLLKGQYYNAPVIDRKDGKPVYARDEKTGRYEIWDDRKSTIPVYDPAYTTIFPRMWNNQEDRYADDYKSWAGITNDPENKHIPTFTENLRYFIRYQLNHMYWRYFFWNFVGRQNDNQGLYADLLNGNWISGIGFIDEMRLGPQNIPASLENKSRNTFFFLPLIFGLIGLYYHFKRNYKDGFVVALLFIMTGLAITIYLNQHSPQPRERDYAYAASFYAFTIWIGLSVLWGFEILSKKLAPKMAAILASGVIFLAVPFLMGAQGWDDHDRSGRYTALEVAKNYLNSCAPNAVLFTNGDNDTFPLWYAQEVEGIRTDVRVCNLSLLNTDWYIDQMLRQAYDSDPLPFTLSPRLYRNGSHDVTFLVEQEEIKDYVEVKELFDIIKEDEKLLQISTGSGRVDYFPTKKFRITVDKEAVLRSGTVPPEMADQITDLEWTLNRTALTKNYLMMFDLLAHNNWERPVYYVATTGDEAYVGLQDYLQLEGFAYRLVPIKRTAPGNDQPGTVNTDVMYDNMMNKFVFNVTKPGFLISDDVNRMSITMRNAYARLIDDLVKEGDLERAVAVADHSIAQIPNSVVPYNYFNLPIAEAYLKNGQVDKGLDILQKLADICSDQLAYYFSFPADKRPYIAMDIQQSIAILNAVSREADQNGQKEFAKSTEETVDFYYNMYVGQSNLQ